MVYLYLLTGGTLISFAHFYLVWRNRGNIQDTLSENAVTDSKAHLIYFVTHLVTDIFFLLYSYQFFIVDHNLALPFIINIVFVVLDLVQGILPSRGKTKKIHITSAYISWICFLLSGIIVLFTLSIVEPYRLFAIVLLILLVCMFLYMHKMNTSQGKVYPYQLIAVPLYVIYMLMITIGAS